jgi:hypothetical protein
MSSPLASLIPLGIELKAWAVTVSGYGTVLEVDHRQAMKEAKHFEGRGRDVIVTELGPLPAPAPEKSLLWNELKPGRYWAYQVDDPEPDTDEETELATVILRQGQLWIAFDDDNHMSLNASWSHYQFVPCKPLRRSAIEFQQTGRVIGAENSGEDAGE